MGGLGYGGLGYGGLGYGGLGYGGLGYGGLGYGGIYSAFPSWGLYGLSPWGLGGWGNGFLNSGYSNPYMSGGQAVASQPVAVYDYSRPIDVAAAPPAAADENQEGVLFESARNAFKAGNYVEALNSTDRALKETPNDPILHEFRALCLFALARYDDAATALYAVLTTGPGWNWLTMIGLYGDSEVYTTQLRA